MTFMRNVSVLNFIFIGSKQFSMISFELKATTIVINFFYLISTYLNAVFLNMQQINNNSSEDFELWEAMLRGDKNAFAKLYERYFKLLYNYGRKIGQDSSHVEDSIHDLFVDLWRYKANLSTTSSVRFYLYRSLRRRLIKKDNNVLWFSQDMHLLEEVLHLTSPSSENEIIESESSDYRVNKLKKLLNDLSPR